MRFCLLTTFYPPWNFGGDGIQVQRLARALAGRGHDVTVLHSPAAHGALGGRAEEREAAPAADGVRVVPVDEAGDRAGPLAVYLSGRPLVTRSRIERELAAGFDVVHFHNPSLLGGPGVLALGSGVKLYTAHEQWLVCPMHVLWQDRRRLCEQPRCVRCSLRHRRPPQPWRATGLLERSLRHLDALIVPSATSEMLHRRLAASAGIPLVRLAHFVEDPGPDPGGADRGRPYLLFAGRLEPIKGVEDLLRAFAVDRGVDLVIAGRGPLEPELRRMSEGLGHVRFTGWLDPRELDRLYRGALAAVVPTAGHEAFGLVAVEALARGVPAIVRDFGALGELAAASEAVLGYRDEAGLLAAAASLRRLGAREELGRLARRSYLAHWTEARHVAAYLAIIARSAAASGRTGLASEAGSAASAETAA